MQRHTMASYPRNEQAAHSGDDGFGAGGFAGADLGDRIVGDQAELEHRVVGGAVFGGAIDSGARTPRGEIGMGTRSPAR